MSGAAAGRPLSMVQGAEMETAAGRWRSNRRRRRRTMRPRGRLGDLERLRLALEALPDEALLIALEKRRGRGRDDYPVRTMWRAVVAMIVLQHPSLEALVRELRRNQALLELCGVDSLGRQGRGRCRREAGPDGPT